MSDNRQVTAEQPGKGSGTTLDAARALRRARRQARQGDYAAAIDSLEAAIRLGADPYDCYLRQASLYRSLGRWGDAVTSAEKAVERGPNRLAAREAVIALLLQVRDYERAVEASRELIRIAPRHMPARDALGAAYMGLGDVDAAIRVANEMIRLETGNPVHRFKRAMLLQHKGEVRMALADFERVLDMSDDPDLSDAAREQLDALDLSQLHGILLLAADDAVFRAKLIMDPERAILERGFSLTDWGLRRLADLAVEDLDNFPGSWTPRSYH
jgi:tetratricopeptide (TPR) repeat protein